MLFGFLLGVILAWPVLVCAGVILALRVLVPVC
jgi:hypothetical protein